MADGASTLHRFWSTQPVPQPGAAETERVGPVERVKTVDEVSTEPLAIASTFEWWTPNLEDDDDMRAIYELLRDNYVEDDDSMFRFNYPEEFLRWAMTPPGYHPSWHVAVRRKRDKLLLGFVSGVPLRMRMGSPKALLESKKASEEQQPNEKDAEENHLEPRIICEINFLCVRKQLREKRMAPILIQEVTRRVNLLNIWQAIYTAGTLLPTPFTSARYFHRSLNPEKLVAISFSRIPPQYQKFQNPMSMLKRFYQLPDAPKTRGLRPMKPKDVPEVTKLLRDKLATYDVAPVFNEKEVAHFLLPREEVVVTYVVEREGGHSGGEESGSGKSGSNTSGGNVKGKSKGAGKRITDFFSFYALPSTVIGNSKYSLLKAAYVYYYVATSVPSLQLMNDLLIVAFKMGFDVCNLVDILENSSFISDLKFATGDGSLHYYFYNWAYPKVQPSDVGLVML